MLQVGIEFGTAQIYAIERASDFRMKMNEAQGRDSSLAKYLRKQEKILTQTLRFYLMGHFYSAEEGVYQTIQTFDTK